MRLFARATAPRAGRFFHSGPALRLPYKDSQDRESLRPRAQENTKSNGDDDTVAHTDAAFNPSTTRPETEHAQAGKGREPGNPLNASGANQPINKPRGDEKTSEGNGPGREVNKGGPSRRGSAPKKGVVPGS